MTKKEIKKATRERIHELKQNSKRDVRVSRAESRIKDICEKYELDFDRFIRCDYTSSELIEMLVAMKNSDRKKLSAAWTEYFHDTAEIPAVLAGVQA